MDHWPITLVRLSRVLAGIDPDTGEPWRSGGEGLNQNVNFADSPRRFIVAPYGHPYFELPIPDESDDKGTWEWWLRNSGYCAWKRYYDEPGNMIPIACQLALGTIPAMVGGYGNISCNLGNQTTNDFTHWRSGVDGGTYQGRWTFIASERAGAQDLYGQWFGASDLTQLIQLWQYIVHRRNVTVYDGRGRVTYSEFELDADPSSMLLTHSGIVDGITAHILGRFFQGKDGLVGVPCIGKVGEP